MKGRRAGLSYLCDESEAAECGCDQALQVVAERRGAFLPGEERENASDVGDGRARALAVKLAFDVVCVVCEEGVGVSVCVFVCEQQAVRMVGVLEGADGVQGREREPWSVGWGMKGEGCACVVLAGGGSAQKAGKRRGKGERCLVFTRS